MNIEEIQKFLDKKTTAESYVRISFKKRNAIYGLFVKDHKDYGELKAKNFWRIIPRSQFDAFKVSNDVGLAKIFSGSEFSRLALHKEDFEEEV
jgi:hypothetical protein